MQTTGDVAQAYDTVAAAYHRLIPDLSAESHLDRAMLTAFTHHVGDHDDHTVLDAGCGTGRVVPTLTAAGLRVTGVDLSAEMLAVARSVNPDSEFAVAGLDRLPFASGRFGGVLAWYSLIHTAPAELLTLASELARVLAPGGFLLTGFQLGAGSRLITDAYGPRIALTAHRFSLDLVTEVLAGAGLQRIAAADREPAGEAYGQGFVLARKGPDHGRSAAG
ncbi:class I SAM-dependent methyltransferase [Microlunatus sp. Y2014]|uniref:class I SAM-dependent methyltransferase n=1 Tax=Microlunatus sp. Y2014 TaxID=3418488 RepID=UPI003DA777E6